MTRRISDPHKLGDFQHEATWLQDLLLLPNGLILIPLRSADLFPSTAHLDNGLKETRTTTLLGDWRSEKFQQPTKILQNRSPSFSTHLWFSTIICSDLSHYYTFSKIKRFPLPSLPLLWPSFLAFFFTLFSFNPSQPPSFRLSLRFPSFMHKLPMHRCHSHLPKIINPATFIKPVFGRLNS